MRMRFSVVLCNLLLAVSLRAQTAPATTQPLPPPDVAAIKTGSGAQVFLESHQKFLEQAKAGNIDLLFLGDSITHNWTKAPEIWKERYEPLHAANFGIGGDRTQHVLWRIENGELDGIHPKVVVLMIGTNNTSSDSADAIAKGVTKIVTEVREKTGAKVLLLGIFPRNKPNDKPEQMQTIHQINSIISKLDNGTTIRYLDIGDKFLGPDGKVHQEIMSDFLHPTDAGYKIWADAMQPLLDEMMK